MSQILQAKCPGCQKVLRFPVEWVSATVRCKHCSLVVRVKSTSAAAKSEGDSAHKNGEVQAAAITAAPPAPPAETANPRKMEMSVSVAPPPAVPDFTALSASHDPFSQMTEEPPLITPRYRRRKRGVVGTLIRTFLFLLVLGGLAYGGYYAYQNRDRLLGPPEQVEAKVEKKPKKATDLATASGDFPRRLLAISVNNYWYANPVSYGEKSRKLDEILGKLGDALRIPKSQITLLSDSSSSDSKSPIPTEPHAPLKPVIETTVTDFLNGSRAQDRIVILFIGHAVEVEDHPYLVPIEGEFANKESLIPLTWLYDAMSKCKARQKVLIMDVCRFNPSRGLERPGSGPMGAKLDTALQNPPTGVQVWSACVAGQYSYEGGIYLPSKEVAQSGLFLNELYESVGPTQQKRVKLNIQKPEEPLPLETMAEGEEYKGVHKQTLAQADGLYRGKQTPRLAGSEAPGGADYDAGEPLPQKLPIKPPPEPPGGVAAKGLVKNLLSDIDLIPPVKMPSETIQPLRVESLKPFSAKLLEKYKEDKADTPLRQEIEKAIKLLKDPKISKAFDPQIPGNADEAAFKRIVLRGQREPAIIESELKEEWDELTKFKEDAKGETSLRWQANYEYVLAKVEARRAFVLEYNFMRGQIRKDALPPRDPAKHTGWRLASQEKLESGAEARNLAKSSRDRLKKLAAKHAGTPWEIFARRESLTAMGLKWEVTRE